MSNSLKDLDILDQRISNCLDSKKTIVLCTRRLKVKSKDYQAHFKWAEQYRKQREFHKDKQRFMRFTQFFPYWNTFYNEWLFALYCEREFEEAILFAEKYYGTPSIYLRIHNVVGVCYLHLGDYANAIKYFQKEITKKDPPSLPYFNRALALYLQEKKDEAIEMYNRACEAGKLSMDVYEREVSMLEEDLKREENKGLEDFIKRKIEGFQYFLDLEKRRN